tara:strand:+ start:5548 stop:6021 length:474 start_codon:yes stop_codon:yes gene_type:complete
MNNNYLNIYNNLIKLTRNKSFFQKMTNNETFSDRLIVFLFHFAFLLKSYKEINTKNELQDLYDFIFKQLEISIREIGYGDMSINKKMKDYINILHAILKSLYNWEHLNYEKKAEIIKQYLDKIEDIDFFINYFDKYREFLINNTLNSLSKDIIDFKV